MLLKDKLLAYVNAIGSPKSGVRNPSEKSNTGSALFRAFVWQEISSHAEKEGKKAWAEVLEIAGQDDDSLREHPQGESILLEGGAFSAIVKITAPRKTFSKEAFIAAVAKQYKIPVAKLEALAAKCVVEGKPPVSKRVLTTE